MQAIQNFEYTINIFAWQRLESLKRLLVSIQHAKYSSREKININFYLDFNFTNNVYQLVKKFSWKYGLKEIYPKKKKTGLLKMIPYSWIPKSNNEYAFFFEDDIEVHEDYFLYTKKILRKYAKNKNIAGISLNTPRFDEVNIENSIWPPPDLELNSNLFLLQQPSSWGALYFPETWTKFVHFFTINIKKENIDPTIPFTAINGWHSSWKKHFMEYMYLHSLMFIFPLFKNEACLAIHHSETGVHYSKKYKYDYYENVFISRNESRDFLESRLNNSLPAFNFYYIKIENVKMT